MVSQKRRAGPTTPAPVRHLQLRTARRQPIRACVPACLPAPRLGSVALAARA